MRYGVGPTQYLAARVFVTSHRLVYPGSSAAILPRRVTAARVWSSAANHGAVQCERSGAVYRHPIGTCTVRPKCGASRHLTVIAPVAASSISTSFDPQFTIHGPKWTTSSHQDTNNVLLPAFCRERTQRLNLEVTMDPAG